MTELCDARYCILAQLGRSRRMLGIYNKKYSSKWFPKKRTIPSCYCGKVRSPTIHPTTIHHSILFHVDHVSSELTKRENTSFKIFLILSPLALLFSFWVTLYHLQFCLVELVQLNCWTSHESLSMECTYNYDAWCCDVPNGNGWKYVWGV